MTLEPANRRVFCGDGAACLRTGTHYLDITGEIAVLEDIHSRKNEIIDAGIVAIPAVGWPVDALDRHRRSADRRSSSRVANVQCFFARSTMLSRSSASR